MGDITLNGTQCQIIHRNGQHTGGDGQPGGQGFDPDNQGNNNSGEKQSQQGEKNPIPPLQLGVQRIQIFFRIQGETSSFTGINLHFIMKQSSRIVKGRNGQVGKEPTGKHVNKSVRQVMNKM